MPTTIQDAIQAAAPGETITIPSGTYDVSGLVLPGNITVQASGSVTLVGNMTLNGPNTVIKGFTFSDGQVDIGHSEGATIENCVFNGGANSIYFDGAHGALIANNSFHNVTGNVIDGWGLDQSTISGNQFYNSWQPINLEFNNDPSHGRDITIEQNYFTGTQRMDIEVGPVEAYTSNMVVKGNWSENMNNAGPTSDGQGTDVAYSIVQSNGVNTLIEGNHASGPGTGIGIELNGSGEVKGNYIDNFWYGTIVYGSGYNVHDNAFVHTTVDPVLNYSGGGGAVQNNATDATGFTMPEVPNGSSAADTGTVDPAGDPPSGVSTSAPADPSVVDSAASSATADPAAGHTSDSSGGLVTDPNASTDPVANNDPAANSASTDPAANNGSTDPVANGGSSDPSTVQAQPSQTAGDGHSTDPASSTDAIATDGTTDPSQVQASDPPSAHATVSVGGTIAQDPALTAPDASALETAYKSLLHDNHSQWLKFDIEGTAAQDPNSIALRDHAIADLQAANAHLKVAFTATASAAGLDATEVGLLQNAKDDGVRIDAVKLVVPQSDQSAALAATHQQLAELGLDAKVGIVHDGGSTGTPATTVDGSGAVPNPFEFSGLLHDAHHVG
jgi:hypothetical protein